MKCPLLITTLLSLFVFTLPGMAETKREALERKIRVLQDVLISMQENMKIDDQNLIAHKASKPKSGAAARKQYEALLNNYELKKKQSTLTIKNISRELAGCQKQLENLKE